MYYPMLWHLREYCIIWFVCPEEYWDEPFFWTEVLYNITRSPVTTNLFILCSKIILLPQQIFNFLEIFLLQTLPNLLQLYFIEIIPQWLLFHFYLLITQLATKYTPMSLLDIVPIY